MDNPLSSDASLSEISSYMLGESVVLLFGECDTSFPFVVNWVYIHHSILPAFSCKCTFQEAIPDHPAPLEHLQLQTSSQYVNVKLEQHMTPRAPTISASLLI
jgi:hypothetical protein